MNREPVNHFVLSPVSRNSAVMLAGLWEFPGWPLDNAAASNRVCLRQAVDDKLPELIGTTSMSALGSLQVVRRVHLGSVLHTFSHIQQTMHIELLVLQVCSLVLCCQSKCSLHDKMRPIHSMKLDWWDL